MACQSNMGACTYPTGAIRADYLRAGAGLALTLGPLALVGFNAHPLVALALLGGAGIFGWFGLRTLFRQQLRVHLRADGLAVETRFSTQVMAWAQIRQVRLRYFSTKRDRSDGWMQLTLRSDHQRVSLESTLNGFDLIAARVARVVLDSGLTLDTASKENFMSLGHYVGE